MTLSKRIFLYFFSIFFLIIAIIAYFQYQRERTFRSEQLDQQLTIYNYSIHKFILERGVNWDELSEYVQFFPDSALRVTVITRDGNVLYDSFVKKGEALDNHIHRPEIEMANESVNGKAIRHSHSTGKDYYYLAHKFPGHYIRSALPYNLSLISVLKANTKFLYFMIILMFLSMLALYFVSRKFSKSIDRLRLFIKNAQQKDLPLVEMEFSNDELGEISKNILNLYKLQIETKEEVNKEREKLITHLQISQEGLGIFSAHKKEILVNSHFIQYINIIADRYCESPDQLFMLPEFAEINEFVDRSIHNNKLNKKQLTIYKGVRVLSVRCIVFQDSTFEVSINDISIQERENELKRHLTQNISHELKTPVSSILGYMESIINNPDMDRSRQRFFIERSYQQALRLTSLLQDISTLNKMDEAKRMFEKEVCNIYQLVSDVQSDVHLEIERKQCIVKNFLNSDIVVYGNRSLLYSVFRNLIDNALAYAGERVTIEVNCFREDEQYYYFSFTDNGVGIAEEHLSRLFDRFYRVDKGRSRKVGGTGLGLSIVKNAVIFHHGNISVKNIPTGGLSFIFSLRRN